MKVIFSHDFSTLRITLDFYRLCDIVIKIPCLYFGLHSHWIMEGKEMMKVLTFYLRISTNFNCNKILQTSYNTVLNTTKWRVTSSVTVKHLMSYCRSDSNAAVKWFVDSACVFLIQQDILCHYNTLSFVCNVHFIMIPLLQSSFVIRDTIHYEEWNNFKKKPGNIASASFKSFLIGRIPWLCYRSHSDTFL